MAITGPFRPLKDLQALVEHDAGPQTRQQHFSSLVLREERRWAIPGGVVCERMARRGLQDDSDLSHERMLSIVQCLHDAASCPPAIFEARPYRSL